MKMKVLNLNCNDLGDAGAHILSKCVHKIDDLYLEACDIMEEGVKALAEQIKERDLPVNTTLTVYQYVLNRSGEASYDIFCFSP